ncbi:hypothetical protein ATANTOWER_019754 [Ataeniobius toweri]|uniref:Uncharacterized protein n=1 Tax=Ataeniobius toweri TaxID=208326 RepID=A0ABU7B8I8_9TELE|nr:hypothetical protein [Ataeniobius toweri]
MDSLNCCLVHKHKQHSEPVPSPIGYPFVHRGEPQRTGAEMGGNKYAHLISAPLTRANSRVECPTPLKETGSRARAVRRSEPDYFYPEPFYLAHQVGLLPHQRGDIPRPKSQHL